MILTLILILPLILLHCQNLLKGFLLTNYQVISLYQIQGGNQFYQACFAQSIYFDFKNHWFKASCVSRLVFQNKEMQFISVITIKISVKNVIKKTNLKQVNSKKTTLGKLAHLNALAKLHCQKE